MENTYTNVWDLFVRIFHWLLVILFTIDYFTGEEGSITHVYAGYLIGGLVFSRVIWGFTGGSYARFSAFIRSPADVISYVKSLVAGNPDYYVGHNPAGGYMIIVLLLMVSFTTITGLKVYGIEGHGPLAGNTISTIISVAQADEDERGEHDEYIENEEGGDAGSSEKFWEEVHEVSANLTVLLILLHVLGVIVSSRLHQENLVRAMITGRKNKRSA